MPDLEKQKTEFHNKFTADDVLDLTERFNAIEREHNEREERIGQGFRESERKAVYDWEVEVPEFDFEW